MVEAVHPSTPSLGLPSAVIGMQDIVKRMKDVNIATSSKTRCRCQNSDPKPSPIGKLPFAATGMQEIVQEESIVDFSTILRLRYNNSFKLYVAITRSLIMTNGWVSMIDRIS